MAISYLGTAILPDKGKENTPAWLQHSIDAAYMHTSYRVFFSNEMNVGLNLDGGGGHVKGV